MHEKQHAPYPQHYADQPPSYWGPGAAYATGPVPQQQTVIVLTSPTISGPDPTTVTCPHCRQAVLTETVGVKGAAAWMTCAVIALMGCFCGCCLIPFYTNSCQDVEHRCSQCHQYIGTYRVQYGRRRW